jgi:hypothetical protein
LASFDPFCFLDATQHILIGSPQAIAEKNPEEIPRAGNCRITGARERSGLAVIPS